MILGDLGAEVIKVERPDYMNQSLSDTSRTSRLSEVLNPNYKDLRSGWAGASPSSPLEDVKPLPRAPEGPEYLNTAQSSLPMPDTAGSLDNPDYQAHFLPDVTGDRGFLPAAENLEYLGLSATFHTPVL